MQFSTLRNSTAAFGGVLLALALLASPASAVPARQTGSTTHARPATAARGAGRLPLSAGQVAADQRRDLASLHRASSVTGVVRDQAGQPLADVCVTATGPGQARTAVSGQDGRFLLAGLRPGRYLVSYRGCSSAGWQRGAGPLPTTHRSQRVIVTGQPLQTLAPVRLPTTSPPAGRPQGRGLTIRPASPVALARQVLGLAARPTAGQRAAAARSSTGLVTGRVTSKGGHAIGGICVIVELLVTETTVETKTAADGRYRLRAPAGSSEVGFLAGCGNKGNWVGELYRNTYDPQKAQLIGVRAGHTVSGINAVLSPGGQISGSVATAAGQKLTDVCVNPLAVGKGFQYLFAPSTLSEHGSYQLRDLPSGRYQLEFVPCLNSQAQYAPVLWNDKQNRHTAGVVRLRAGGAVAGINEVLPVGGVITGTVTDSSGQPLSGICVLAASAEPWDDYFFAQTAADGSYQIIGAPTSTYQLFFALGCGNDGNYLGGNTPRNVKVTDGSTTSGVSITLLSGAVVSGTVTGTNKAPVKGICVVILGGPFDADGGLTETLANGSYSMDQLPAASYTVEFSGGCGNHGSYAPQAWDSTNPETPTPIKLSTGQQATAVDAVLPPGGTISGTVTRGSGKKLTGICVAAGPTVAMQQSGGSAYEELAQTTGGGYKIANIPPGNYAVLFGGNCGNGADLANQWYQARPGPAGASSVWAGAGLTAADINARLTRGGAFTGHFLTAAGHVVVGTCLQATDLTNGVQSPFYEFYSDGEPFSAYQLSDLLPGRYQVMFNSACAGTDYATQWYADSQTEHGARIITIKPGGVVDHVSSALVAGGSITGRVTAEATGKPVGDVCVFAQSTSQPDYFGMGRTSAHGYYSVPSLNTSDYELLFGPCNAGGDGNLAAALLQRVVHATIGSRTEGVNIALAAGGKVEGTVTAGSPAAGQPDICVQAVGLSNDLQVTTTTAADGSYRLQNMPAGGYHVYFAEPSCGIADLLAPQVYASEVTVTAGPAATGVNADLAADGSISGKVTGAGGSPLSGVCVAAIGTAAGSGPVAESTASGTYTIGGLVPGSYVVRFASGCGAAGYRTQWWQDASSRGTAKIITVAPGSALTGISASMRS